MAKNKIQDLTDHLFAQLERLDDESLSGEKLAEEVEKSKAITGIAKDILSTGKLALEAQKFKKEFGLSTHAPRTLGLDHV